MKKSLNKFITFILLFTKIYNRTNTFRIQKKNNFELHFNLWKTKKNPKIYRQMSYKAIVKDPPNYEEHEIEKINKVLLIFLFLKKQSDQLWLKLLQKNIQKKENT